MGGHSEVESTSSSREGTEGSQSKEVSTSNGPETVSGTSMERSSVSQESYEDCGVWEASGEQAGGNEGITEDSYEDCLVQQEEADRAKESEAENDTYEDCLQQNGPEAGTETEKQNETESSKNQVTDHTEAGKKETSEETQKESGEETEKNQEKDQEAVQKKEGETVPERSERMQKIEQLQKEMDGKQKELEAARIQLEEQNRKVSGQLHEVMGMDRQNPAYREKLAAYNAARSELEAMSGRVNGLQNEKSKLDGVLGQEKAELYNDADWAAYYGKGQMAKGDENQSHFEEIMLEKRPSREKAEALLESNETLIAQMEEGKRSLVEAAQLKAREFSDYVTQSNLSREQALADPTYQRLAGEYEKYREAGNQLDYSIGKLTENNRQLQEVIEENEKQGKIGQFFSGLFGAGHQESTPTAELPAETQAPEEKTETKKTEMAEKADDGKLEQVRKIESMDPGELSEADKKFIYDTVQNHLREQYKGQISEERIQEISNQITIATTEKCREIYESNPANGPYLDTTLGFYNTQNDKIYIDAPRNKTSTELVATIDHEGLHLVSNGGIDGFIRSADGKMVSSYNVNLDEGITELLATRDVKDMGFEYESECYTRQTEVVAALEEAMGKEVVEAAYLGNRPELLRSEFEARFENPEVQKEIAGGKVVVNGKYQEFMRALDCYIATDRDDPQYETRKQEVFNLIEACKNGKAEVDRDGKDDRKEDNDETE